MTVKSSTPYRVWIEGPAPMPRRYFPMETFSAAEGLFYVLSDTQDSVNVAIEVFDERKLTWKIYRRSTVRGRKRRRRKSG